VSLNLHPWLIERLEYAPELDALLHGGFAETLDGDESLWSPFCYERFAQWLCDTYPGKYGEEATGIYGDGEPFTVNTYNGEDALSQVIQYAYAETEAGTIVVLQIHGGCDVRGGYTAPRAFWADESMLGECAIFDNARAIVVDPIIAESDDWQHRELGRWSTENGGYTWHTDSGDKDLQDWPSEDSGLSPPFAGVYAELIADLARVLDDYADGGGNDYRRIVVDDAHNAYSPLTGAELEAHAY
jgi:hypothetical protein